MGYNPQFPNFIRSQSIEDSKIAKSSVPIMAPTKKVPIGNDGAARQQSVLKKNVQGKMGFGKKAPTNQPSSIISQKGI